MKYLSILDPVLDALHDGRVFRRVFSVALKVAAGLVVLGTALTLMTALGLAFQDFMPAEARIGVLLFAVALVAMAGLQVNVLLYHARGVEQLPPTAIVLSSIVFAMMRMIGECYAIFMCAIGVGGFLASLFGAGSVISQTGLGLMPGLGMASGAGGGIALLVTSLILAFVGLTIAYFVAEQGGMLADIAVNLRRLAPYSSPAAAMTPTPMPIPASILAASSRATPVPSPTPTATLPRPTPLPPPASMAPPPPPPPPPPAPRASAITPLPPITPTPAAARRLTPPPVAAEPESRRCRNCNAFLGPAQLFCIECGTRAAG